MAKKPDLHDFVDDNTIAVNYKNQNDLFHTLKKESESAVDWFRNNNIISNPNRYLARYKKRSIFL